jgi:hypothetical protein
VGSGGRPYAVCSRILTSPVVSRRSFRLASVDPERDCSALTAQLSEACAVVDVLEPFVRDELTGQVCNREMTAYTQVSAFCLSNVLSKYTQSSVAH